MSPSSMSRAGRLAMVASLYSTQNLCLAVFTYTFLTAAQKAGVPLALIGSASGLGLLLVLKFLWAPLVDRFGWSRVGHYRGWLLATQTGLVVGALVLSILDPARQFGMALAVFAPMFLLAGTQDVAADATATRLLPPDERGLGNGFQAAGASAAQVLGGGLLLLMSGIYGWRPTMWALALLSAVPLPFVMSWREQASTGHLAAPTFTWRGLRTFFSRPGVARWALLLPLYFFGGTVAYNLVRPILIGAGWTEARLGTLVVIVGGVAGIVAGVGGGALISRVSRLRAIAVLGVVQVVAAAATVLLTFGSPTVGLVVVVTLLSNAAFAAVAAVTFTIAMDLSRPESSGTDFTLFSTLTTVMMVVAAGGGIALSGVLGFRTVTLLAVVVAVVGLVVVVRFAGPVGAELRVREPGEPAGAAA